MRRRKKKSRAVAREQKRRSANIKLGTAPGIVAVRFDRPLSSMDLSPKDALALSIGLAKAAREANDKLIAGTGLAAAQPVQSDA